jgi:hypothetical protein
MSTEKRKVSTDALETLGTIIQDGGRDAIHLAVEPVIAGEELRPGANVGLRAGKAFSGTDKAYPNWVEKHLGIVDPFLKQPVNPGEKFWLVVYPRQITSLRHVWSHPDFPEDSPTNKSGATTDPIQTAKDWITQWGALYSLSYEELMSVADENTNGGYEYINVGNLEGLSVPDEFWDNYEIIRDKKVSDSDRSSFFSCSC